MVTTTMNLEYADPGLPAAPPLAQARTRSWQVAQIEAARRRLAGNGRLRRLRLWLDVLLSGGAPGEELPISLYLESDCWEQDSPWPPLQERAATLPAPGAGPQLGFRIVAITRRRAARSDEGFWQQYLTPQRPPEESRPGGAGRPLADALLDAVGEYLAGTLEITSVDGALRFLEAGPAGSFGPVATRVLERSGRADLRIDATLLGEASDAEEQGGEATLRLALYGDRHGAWILHRLRLRPRKARRGAPPPAATYDGEVLVADEAAELLRLAGLGRTEKSLFTAAAILPPEDLRGHYLPEHADSADSAGGAAAAIDLAQIDARSRRYVDGILQLVRDRRLTPADLDALLRIARQLGRHPAQ